VGGPCRDAPPPCPCPCPCPCLAVCVRCASLTGGGPLSLPLSLFRAARGSASGDGRQAESSRRAPATRRGGGCAAERGSPNPFPRSARCARWAVLSSDSLLCDCACGGVCSGGKRASADQFRIKFGSASEGGASQRRSCTVLGREDPQVPCSSNTVNLLSSLSGLWPRGGPHCGPHRLWDSSYSVQPMAPHGCVPFVPRSRLSPA